MSAEMPGKNPEELFTDSQFQMHFEAARDLIGVTYLSDEDAARFRSVLRMEKVSESQMGQIIPTSYYDSRDKLIHMHVDPDATIEFAEKIAGVNGDALGDIVRVLVGAGVARCALAWKLLPIKLNGEHEEAERVKAKLYDEEALLAYAQSFDIQEGTQLEESIRRMGDNRRGEINILRFAIGASLTQLFGGINWQQQWAPLMRKHLKEELEHRSANLQTAFSLIEAESAFAWFDDNAPELLIALSFPMTPGEELQSFAAENPK